MSAPFDAYHKWLGIPPAEQPPNHYRLLGVPLFEADADVIANAADRSMAHLRTFQSGQFSAESQRLLNEVSAARVCLLNAAKKVAYDQQLRARQRPVAPPQSVASPPAAAPRMATPVRVVAPVPVLPSQPVAIAPVAPQSSFDFDDDPMPSRRSRQRRKNNSSMSTILVLAVLLAAAAIGALVWTTQSPSTDARNPTTASPTKKPKSQPPKSAVPPNPPQPKKEPPAVEPQPKPRPQPKEKPRPQPKSNLDPSEVMDGPEATVPGEDPDGSAPIPGPREVNLPEGLPFSTRPTGNRKPVPNEDDRKAAMKTIHDLFDKKYSDAKAPEKKFDLAQELFRQARDTRDDLAARYALFEESRRLASEACAPQAIMDVVSAIASDFEIDDVETTVLSFEIAAKSPTGAAPKKLLVDTSLLLVDEAVRRQRFDAARRLATVARGAASKANDANLIAAAGARTKLLADQQKAYEAAAKSIEALAAVPDDPEANFLAGRYHALIEKKWDKGLPMLAKGNNPAYQNAAKLDIAQPSEPEDHAKIGEAWAAIQEESPYYQHLCRARAVHWYRLALSGLTGLRKASLEKQLVAMSSEDAKPVTRIVVWNEHNANSHDNGTKTCTLVLYHHGKEVWRKPNVALLWEANRDMWNDFKVPSVIADSLKVEINTWQKNGGGLSEVEVYSGPTNLAKNGSATASAELDSNHPARAVIDGVKSSIDQNYGYWLLPENSTGSVEISLSPYE